MIRSAAFVKNIGEIIKFNLQAKLLGEEFRMAVSELSDLDLSEFLANYTLSQNLGLDDNSLPSWVNDTSTAGMSIGSNGTVSKYGLNKSPSPILYSINTIFVY